MTKSIHRRGFGATILALATAACGAEPLESSEILDTERQAAESIYDVQVAAVIEVTMPMAPNILYVFACDANGNLQRNFWRNGWSGWQHLSSGCTSAPAVGLWKNIDGSGEDALLLYCQFGDGLWEGYWPDHGLSTVWWNRVRGAGLSWGRPIASNITTRNQGMLGIASLITRFGSEYYSLTWTHLNPHWNMAAMWVPNAYHVSTRGGLDEPWTVGKGTNEDPTMAWYGKNYYLNGPAASGHTDFLAGSTATPTIVIDPLDGTNRREMVARFGHDLKTRNMSVPSSTWSKLNNCNAWGRPVAPTMAVPGKGFYGFVRGGVNTSDLSTFDYTGCTSKGGTLYSSPTPVEWGSTYKGWACYKGSSSKLYCYNAQQGVHTNLGLTLP